MLKAIITKDEAFDDITFEDPIPTRIALRQQNTTVYSWIYHYVSHRGQGCVCIVHIFSLQNTFFGIRFQCNVMGILQKCCVTCFKTKSELQADSERMHIVRNLRAIVMILGQNVPTANW